MRSRFTRSCVFRCERYIIKRNIWASKNQNKGNVEITCVNLLKKKKKMRDTGIFDEDRDIAVQKRPRSILRGNT